MSTTDDAARPSPPTTPPTSAPTPPGPSPRPRGTRGPLLAAVLGLIGLALAVLAWGVPTGTVLHDETTIRPSGSVDRIDLTVDAGDLDVTSGDEIRLHATRPGRDLVVENALDDGVLEVRVACPRLALLRGCRTPVQLVVPPGVPLTARTEAGAITASGLTAGADLRTGAGSIDVDDLAGPVRLSSDAGALRGTVRSGTIEARTSSGAITLRVLEEVRHLVATTEVGAIHLTVPEATTYQVDAGATLGRTDVDVAHTPGADRSLEARSEIGRISIRTVP